MNLETLSNLHNRLKKEVEFMNKINEYIPTHIINSHIEPLINCAKISKKIVETWYSKGEINESEIKELEKYVDDIEEDKF